MVFPYLTVDAHDIVSCLCKGCGEWLWRKGRRADGTDVNEVRPIYGDLYLALVDNDGILSQHSTPCCPSCAKELLNGSAIAILEEWWGADVFHWFIEARAEGKDPDTAYRITVKLQGDRHVVRALRYEPRL